MRTALITAGIELLDDEDGVGVRRRRSIVEITHAESRAALDAQPTAIQLQNSERIVGRQSRAARGLLAISQTEASKKLGVGLSLLVSFETEASVPHLKNLAKIKEGYERAGIAFIESDEIFGAAIRRKERDL